MGGGLHPPTCPELLGDTQPGGERPHGRDTHQPTAHDVEVITGEEGAGIG